MILVWPTTASQAHDVSTAFILKFIFYKNYWYFIYKNNKTSKHVVSSRLTFTIINMFCHWFFSHN